MQNRSNHFVRLMMAVFVTLSLAFLPMLSQQAMAGHHVNDDISLAMTSDDQGPASSSCAKKSDSQSSDMQMDCCDINCSDFNAFATIEVLAGQLQIADHFESDTEQLTSYTIFGLMRPPRA